MQSSENEILQKETFLLKLSASMDRGFPFMDSTSLDWFPERFTLDKSNLSYSVLGAPKLIVHFSDQAILYSKIDEPLTSFNCEIDTLFPSTA